MQASEYQTQFGRTLAPVFFPQNVHPVYVGRALRNRKQSADFIDALKRALYYNKPDRLYEILGSGNEVANKDDAPYNVEPELLHSILGMEGEVGELTEAILTGDRARVVDESGDFFWFLCLAFRKFGITFEEVFDRNVAKLAARYPEKFTIEAAVNRDLDAEAKVFQQ